MASIFGKIFRMLMIERGAKGKSVNELIAQLRTGHQTLLNQIDGAEDNKTNRAQLSHAIGIERWGQSRLRVVLGAPLNMEEYYGYRPAREVPVDQLVQQFDETRQETLVIAEELTAVANVASKEVEHNLMGNMSVPSWLFYLDMHSNFELRKVS